jgi:hypothetical protein
MRLCLQHLAQLARLFCLLLLLLLGFPASWADRDFS